VELAIYIKKLLYNHDILVIPGLGGLMTQYKPAEINTTDQTIAPPSKYLAFDMDLIDTDGLLSNYISSQKAISQEEADKFIQNEVDSILHRLDEKETILFEGIGYFSKVNGVIRFEREPEANFLTDSFGLSNIDYTPVEYGLSPKKNQEKEKSSHRRSYSMLLMFASIAALVVASIFVYLNYPDIVARFSHTQTYTPVVIKSVPNDTDKVAENKIEGAQTSKDTTKPSDLEKFFDNSTNKKKALALDSDELASKPQPDVTYYLIAGSFKTFERAKVLSKSLSKEGFKAEIIQFEQDKYRVSLGEYKDKSEAQTQMDKITSAKGADAVWMLKK